MKYLIALSILAFFPMKDVCACERQPALSKMTEEEAAVCGINKLNDEEKVALSAWLHKNKKMGHKKWGQKKWAQNKTKAIATIATVDADKRTLTDDKGVVYKMHPHSIEQAKSFNAGDQVTVISNGRWSKVKKEGVNGKVWAKKKADDHASSGDSSSSFSQ